MVHYLFKVNNKNNKISTMVVLVHFFASLNRSWILIKMIKVLFSTVQKMCEIILLKRKKFFSEKSKFFTPDMLTPSFSETFV